jgi:hypothetical protein
MEQRVRALWQRQIPGLAELEMEQQRPSKANPAQHFGEDVHGEDAKPADDPTQYLDDWALPSGKPYYQFLPKRRRCAVVHFS